MNCFSTIIYFKILLSSLLKQIFNQNIQINCRDVTGCVEIEVHITILELNSCPTKYVISARTVFAAFYQDAVYSRIRNYSKTIRVCRYPQTPCTTWNDIST